jgi:RNA polymerase sigma-54 factor
MRFDTSQQMKLGQQMKLSPRMIQSMEILQMPLAELHERLEQELESNPTMEIVEVDGGVDGGAVDRGEQSVSDGALDIEPESADDFARLEEYTDANPEAAENMFSASKDRVRGEDYSGLRSGGDPDSKFEAMAQAPARGASMSEQLGDQWSLCDVDDRVRALGEVLISELDEDGYLRSSFEEIADRAGAEIKALDAAEADWELALQSMQLSLEPIGIGARDARECLLIQIDARLDRVESVDDGEDEEVDGEGLLIARRLVGEFFEDMMKNRLPKIAGKAGLTLDEINLGLGVLKRLSLSPGRGMSAGEQTAVFPDAVVEYDEDGDRYIAYLTDGRLPDVRINRAYAEMAVDNDVQKGDREFLKKNLSNAQWLIDAIGQRRHTLLRVINAVVDEQREYFDFGPEALKPLPMQPIADRLGIHVATVSRAVSEKYIMTPRGVVALRSFFSGGLSTESGEDVSANAVRAAIEDLIENENKAKPLSDEAMVKALKERGIEIARRTVAKYRDQLGIPTARMRKQFGK